LIIATVRVVEGVVGEDSAAGATSSAYSTGGDERGEDITIYFDVRVGGKELFHRATKKIRKDSSLKAKKP
jgi:hypothetical protein